MAGSIRARSLASCRQRKDDVIPGEYVLGEGDIVANANRRTLELVVTNTGDRPIQVGSHFHFFEVNRALRFERAKAFGMRLNVPAGTAVRFEPGDEKRVTLVELAGTRKVYGLNGLTNGASEPDAERLREWEARS
jgi:urease beta subunit